jgi:alpha-tubulin suppressor-like RCC1 family protein
MYGLGLEDKRRVGDEPNEMGDYLPKINLGTNKHAKTLSISSGNTCALLTDNSIKCWGSASSCKLGFEAQGNIGDDPNEMGDNLPIVNLGANRIPTAIAVGAGHSCALLSNGAITCWGVNYRGELGLGNSMSQCPGDNLPTVKLFSNQW